MDPILFPAIVLCVLMAIGAIVCLFIVLFRVKSGKGPWVNSQHPIFKTNELLEKILNDSKDYDALSQIQKLSDLNQAGIITDDEFQAKKSELLNKL